MRKGKIIRSFQGRILLIGIIGLLAGIWSCVMVSYVTIRSIRQNRMEDAMKTNINKEVEHLEFCYFTMVRMMQQLGEGGSTGTMLLNYLQAENNFDRFTRKRELENEIVSIGFTNPYVHYAAYLDSATKVSLFENECFADRGILEAEDIMQIDGNRFEALHPSCTNYSTAIMVSMLRQGQRYAGNEYDIYIEMKANIGKYGQGEGDSSYISLQLDKDGRVLFANCSDFQKGDTLRLLSDENGSFAGEYEGYYLVARTSKMGFVYVNGVPLARYQKEMWEWYERIVVLCLFSLVPVALLVFATKKMLGNPIDRLEQAIIAVGKGKLELVSEDMEIREFNELMHQINEMKIQIRKLLLNVQEEEEKRQKTEREKLMYQINPHFLLNTLNSVQWMAQLAKQEQISRFLSDFKALLAYNLGKEEKTSTLRMEVEIARKYISLQKQRYDFEVVLEVEQGDYLETETIRMLLQPLIENALRYGLGEKDMIEIRIFCDERRGYAVLTIQDFGEGLDREKLEELNRPFCYRGSGTEEMEGIGLRYVRHCLEGFYGSNCILTINSELGRGTKVTIMIPLQAGKRCARQNEREDDQGFDSR